MKENSSIQNIILIWLGWTIVLFAFQHWVHARLDLIRPDLALFWTPAETSVGSQDNKPYLNDPFLNEHVAWDSQFYLSIAIAGYDDPNMNGITPDFAWGTSSQRFCFPGQQPDCISRNYAFFPFYAWLIRIMSWPFRWLPLTTIARATLAAVIISLLGALGAMLGLYFMSRGSLGEEGGVRAAFYLLIFPSGFFLAQVYTEGLFLGLTFGALAFLSARKWVWSALLASLSVWTRPGGVLLLLPMVIIWLTDKSWQANWKTALFRGLACLFPALSYTAWSLTPMASKFHVIEEHVFLRNLLAFTQSWKAWKHAWSSFYLDNSQAQFYYALEFAALALAVLTCLILLKERPEISLFGLAVTVFTATSGVAQGMIRYVLVVPALFWILARWGKNPIFDRVWTLISILLLGVEAMLFSFNFWVA